MWYFLLFAALLGADQLIKYWTVEHLALGESAAFWPGVMRLTRVHNYGAAWSSFSGQTAALAGRARWRCCSALRICWCGASCGIPWA